ncbi:serine hydrolase [Halobacillus karajensis]|uniref:Beta-lactamase class A catalytic domain-containing protein n=1 Tax=Halobacillus karajensis TaxID=195088 RepID=A0A024P480_9BACI|nr:serine hydrolase [Halobacillus karajensis]CDQ20671.1 hypothetical protein BN982_03024 [Halobacillus karajensis]CDQ23859.1 hypothetical protein BN983_02112 [Halobacillus karajensis]CDQ27337.1 hypothetical protein BN981_01593 [Halobacillus karajensis]
MSWDVSIAKLAANVDAEVSIFIRYGDHSVRINEDCVLPAASTIKIPILMEAFRQRDEEMIDFSERISISPKDRVGGDGVLSLLIESACMEFEDLLTLMIVVSDNTASNILMDELGISAINDLCQSLGCPSTKIRRLFMDFDAMQAGINNTTTASDMMRLITALDQGKIGGKSGATQMIEILQHQRYTSGLPAYMTDSNIKFATKTGQLPGICHDLGIFKYREQKVYAVVMFHQLAEGEAGRRALGDIGKVIKEEIFRL